MSTHLEKVKNIIQVSGTAEGRLRSVRGLGALERPSAEDASVCLLAAKSSLWSHQLPVGSSCTSIQSVFVLPWKFCLPTDTTLFLKPRATCLKQ